MDDYDFNSSINEQETSKQPTASPSPSIERPTLPEPSHFPKDLVKFAAYFTGFLVPLLAGLETLADQVQALLAGATERFSENPQIETISRVWAQGLVVFSYIACFAVFWFGTNFIQSRRAVSILWEHIHNTNECRSQRASMVDSEPDQKDQQIKQLSNQLEQQRYHLRKIHEEMYDDKIRVRHDFVSFRARYKVNANGDIEVSKEIILKSPELEVHFWRFYADGGPFAKPLKDDTEMDLEVRALGDNTTDVIAILLENEPTKKVFTVNFLPTIKKGHMRSFMLRYRWHGFFNELVTARQTQYYWDTRSYNDTALADFSAEWCFEEELGDVRCEIPNKYALDGMSLRSEASPTGTVWTYSGRQVPLGNICLALKIWR